MDMQSLASQRQPSDLLSLRYSGIVSPNLSVELQYSSRHLTINTGAPMRDRIQGTLLIDGVEERPLLESDVLRRLRRREARQRRLVRARRRTSCRRARSARITWSSGYDRFNDKIFQNAYASGSDYRIQGTDVHHRADGTSVFPQFLPNSTLIMHTPVRAVDAGLGPADALALLQRQLAAQRAPQLQSRHALGQESGAGRRRRGRREQRALEPSRRGHLGSEGRRPVGAQRELRAVRDADDEQRRGVDDRRGQCVDVRLALSGTRHQSRSERAAR